MARNLPVNLDTWDSSQRFGTYWAAVKPPSIGYGTNILLNAGFENFTGSKDDGTTDTFTSFASNVISNGRVEAVSPGSIPSTGGPSGTVSCKCIVTSAGGMAKVRQGFTMVGNIEYSLSFWTKGDGVNCGSFMIIDQSVTGTMIDRPTYVTSTNWTKVQINLWNGNNSAPGAGYVNFYSYNTNGAAAYFDDVVLSKVVTPQEYTLGTQWVERMSQNISRARGLSGIASLPNPLSSPGGTVSVDFPSGYFTHTPLVKIGIFRPKTWFTVGNFQPELTSEITDFVFPTDLRQWNWAYPVNAQAWSVISRYIMMSGLTTSGFKIVSKGVSGVVPKDNPVTIVWHAFGM